MLRSSFEIVVQIKLYFYLPKPFPISIDTGKENCNCQSMNIKKSTSLNPYINELFPVYFFENKIFTNSQNKYIS